MQDFKIYCDNAIEANWFKNLHPSFAKIPYELIRSRGDNPELIENLIQYDRPDIIFIKGNKPLLVLEKTREVPTGHNIGQRIARLVKALENNILTIKFFPFDARKHGEHTGICNLNIRLLYAIEKMWQIHDTPILAVNWIVDANGELIDDGSEDDKLKVILKNYLESDFDIRCSFFNQIRKENEIEYNKRLKIRPSYGKPPPSVIFSRTKECIYGADIKFKSKDINSLCKNEETVLYVIEMTELSCRREDPYTGMQFIYDYSHCRTGVKPENKNKNLILFFPKIRKKIWLENNPDDKMRKSCNWYLTANALFFKDDYLLLR
jgi:hypothetical protein